MKLSLFTFLAFLSLCLCVAVSCLWVRSYIVRDSFLRQTSETTADYYESSWGKYYYVSIDLITPRQLAEQGWRTDGGLHFGDSTYGGLPFGLFFGDSDGEQVQGQDAYVNINRIPYGIFIFLTGTLPAVWLALLIRRKHWMQSSFVWNRHTLLFYRLLLCHIIANTAAKVFLVLLAQSTGEKLNWGLMMPIVLSPSTVLELKHQIAEQSPFALHLLIAVLLYVTTFYVVFRASLPLYAKIYRNHFAATGFRVICDYDLPVSSDERHTQSKPQHP